MGIQSCCCERLRLGISACAPVALYATGAALGAAQLVAAGALAQEALPAIDVKTKSSSKPHHKLKPKTPPTPKPAASSDQTSETGGAGGYAATRAATGLRINAPLLETPVSIQVVPSELIQDQAAQNLMDALRNVSGVVDADWGIAYVIRGFNSSDYVFRDGVRFVNVTFSQADMSNIEQVEVAKGPGAVLYGRLEPGGMINYITKKPMAEAHYGFEQEIGTFGHSWTKLDATGPLDAARTLLYRLNLSYLNEDSFRDFDHEERIFAAPAFSWRPNANTIFNLTFEYYHDGAHLGSAGVPRLAAGTIFNAPSSVSYSEPGLLTIQDKYLADFRWSHRFAPGWSVESGVVANGGAGVFDAITPISMTDDYRVHRVGTFGPETDQSVDTFVNITGGLLLAGTVHKVLAGSDLHFEWRKRSLYQASDISLGLYQPVTVPSIDLFRPIYGTTDLAALRRAAPNSIASGGNNWCGVYAQDMISVGEKLHFLVGGRYDWATAHGDGQVILEDRSINAQTDDAFDEAFSPRVGAVYQPWRQLSLYANYVEGFGANQGRAADHSPFPPLTAQQEEAGAKVEFFGGRLAGNLAFYNLAKQNILTADPNNPFLSIPIGEAVSQGVELDVGGKLTDQLSISAAYAHTAAYVTKDNGGSVGKRLPGAPLDSGNIWIKYAVAPKTFELGAGAYWNSGAYSDIPNLYALPSYLRVDAFAAYHWDMDGARWTAQLNIKNLLNEKYYQADVWENALAYLAQPRSATAAIRVQW